MINTRRCYLRDYLQKSGASNFFHPVGIAFFDSVQVEPVVLVRGNSRRLSIEATSNFFPSGQREWDIRSEWQLKQAQLVLSIKPISCSRDGLTGYAEPGSIMAIMGPSGSGKSTLLDTLAGTLKLHRPKNRIV